MSVEQYMEQVEQTFDRMEGNGQVVDRDWCRKWIEHNVAIVPGDPHEMSPSRAACQAFDAHRQASGRLYVDRYYRIP